MCLNYIKNGKPISAQDIFWKIQSRYIGSKVLKELKFIVRKERLPTTHIS